MKRFSFWIVNSDKDEVSYVSLPIGLSELYDEFVGGNETVALKEDVIDWLNENIKDRKGSTKETPINERKAWCTGNDEYNTKQSYQIHVFFSRQKDALRFIEHFSIYKKPTFYFDYFHSERREMDIKDIVRISNEYNELNRLPIVEIGETINIAHKTSTDLNEEIYIMIDWETEE